MLRKTKKRLLIFYSLFIFIFFFFFLFGFNNFNSNIITNTDTTNTRVKYHNVALLDDPRVVNIEKAKKRTIISFFSSGYLEMFKIFVKRLKDLDLDENLIVVVLDESSLHDVSKLVPNYIFFDNPVPEHGEWGTEDFQNIISSKYSILLKVMNHTDLRDYVEEYYYSDIDILHLRNPFEYFETFDEEICEFVISGSVKNICTGQFYWKKKFVPKVMDTFEQFNEAMQWVKEVLGDDQRALHYVIKKEEEEEGGGGGGNLGKLKFDINQCITDLTMMPTGDMFFNWRLKDPEYTRKLKEGEIHPYSLHFNYAKGRKTKIEGMKEWLKHLEISE